MPAELAEVPRGQVLDGLHVIDDAMAERLGQAREQGQVLRHVAHLDAEGKARVGVASFPADHAFAHLRLTDNCVQFTPAVIATIRWSCRVRVSIPKSPPPVYSPICCASAATCARVCEPHYRNRGSALFEGFLLDWLSAEGPSSPTLRGAIVVLR